MNSKSVSNKLLTKPSATTASKSTSSAPSASEGSRQQSTITVASSRNRPSASSNSPTPAKAAAVVSPLSKSPTVSSTAAPAQRSGPAASKAQRLVKFPVTVSPVPSSDFPGSSASTHFTSRQPAQHSNTAKASSSLSRASSSKYSSSSTLPSGDLGSAHRRITQSQSTVATATSPSQNRKSVPPSSSLSIFSSSTFADSNAASRNRRATVSAGVENRFGIPETKRGPGPKLTLAGTVGSVPVSHRAAESVPLPPVLSSLSSSSTTVSSKPGVFPNLSAQNRNTGLKILPHLSSAEAAGVAGVAAVESEVEAAAVEAAEAEVEAAAVEAAEAEVEAAAVEAAEAEVEAAAVEAAAVEAAAVEAAAVEAAAVEAAAVEAAAEAGAETTDLCEAKDEVASALLSQDAENNVDRNFETEQTEDLPEQGQQQESTEEQYEHQATAAEYLESIDVDATQIQQQNSAVVAAAAVSEQKPFVSTESQSSASTLSATTETTAFSDGPVSNTVSPAGPACPSSAPSSTVAEKTTLNSDTHAESKLKNSEGTGDWSSVAPVPAPVPAPVGAVPDTTAALVRQVSFEIHPKVTDEIGFSGQSGLFRHRSLYTERFKSVESAGRVGASSFGTTRRVAARISSVVRSSRSASSKTGGAAAYTSQTQSTAPTAQSISNALKAGVTKRPRKLGLLPTGAPFAAPVAAGSSAQQQPKQPFSHIVDSLIPRFLVANYDSLRDVGDGVDCSSSSSGGFMGISCVVNSTNEGFSTSATEQKVSPDSQQAQKTSPDSQQAQGNQDQGEKLRLNDSWIRKLSDAHSIATPSAAVIDSSAFVCSTALLIGDYPISIGRNTIVNPGVVLRALNGPIEIGEGNIIEELTVIDNRSSKTLHIGDFNVIECGCYIEDDSSIGNENQIESKSILGPSVFVGNCCRVASKSNLQRISVQSCSSVYGSAYCKIFPRNEAEAAIQQKHNGLVIAISNRLISILTLNQSRRQSNGLPHIPPASSIVPPGTAEPAAGTAEPAAGAAESSAGPVASELCSV